jgi:hypothetical protein
MVKSLAKILARRLSLKLILVGLSIQLVSLFRNYPSDHPCGRVLEINSALSVLINCDSAVYMKDAQDPIRLFNGESVYQDRPFPTLLVSFLAKIWHNLSLPDYYRQIQGNSGQTVTYSLATYIFFLILSAAVLSLTIFVGIKSLSLIQQKLNVPHDIFVSIALVFVLVISMNEITKTFFWTPGSQMFNLLLPVYLFYLTFFSYQSVSTKFYLFHVLVLILLLFSYAFFIILLVPLLLAKWGKFRHRILLTSLSSLLYLSYPFLLNIFGGEYNNFAVGYRRMYLWVLDAYSQGILYIKLDEYFGYFLKSIPIIPTITLLIALIIFTSRTKSVRLPFRSEVIIVFAHILMISFYGYYSRRLTLPILILLFLISIKKFFCLKNHEQYKVLQSTLIVVLIFLTGSWVFTLGPLV